MARERPRGRELDRQEKDEHRLWFILKSQAEPDDIRMPSARSTRSTHVAHRHRRAQRPVGPAIMARWLAVLIVLMARCAHAADFDAGIEAYARDDYRGALMQWRALARQGDPRAQYRLARMYADGIGVRENHRIALHWYRQAAEQGLVEAQFELALMYVLGHGVRQDDSSAAYWYGRLAEDGHVTAQSLLADMYEDGRGVEKDPRRAVYWYRRAAEQGHAGAQAKLGAMYSQGHGVARDLVQAWAWLDLAAARGHDAAARERTSLRLRLGEEELAQAVKLSRELSPLPVAQPVESEIELDLAQAPELVRIKSGCFAMGSDPGEPGRHDNEARHSVCVEDFSISRYEVTRGQYAVFVKETGRGGSDDCQTYDDGGWASRAGRSWRDPGFAQSDDHPVVCVSRDDALAYARWLSELRGRGYRLPTEAEWEYAARAGSGAARPSGNDPGQTCRWANVGDRALHRHYREWRWTLHPCDDGHVHTAPVGSYRRSRYGLHDMVGNVWEWTCSSYDAAYRGAERRCAPGAHSGVARGGSWSNSPRWTRSAGRFGSRVDARFDLVGFRLAHD